MYLEKSDRYGLQLKPNPDVVSVDRIGRISSADGMNRDLKESAATDGGAEFEQLEPKVKQEILENYEAGDTVKTPHVAGSLGESPETVEKTLEGVAKRGGRGIMRHPENPDAYLVE